MGEELSTNPLVDMIAFTGSTETGKRIREVSARTMKRVQLELGGKSAHVVLDDVTESEVAGIGFGQVLMHSGQAMCCRIAPAITGALTRCLRRGRQGDGV